MVDKLYMTHSDNRSVEKENYECKIDLAPWLQAEFYPHVSFAHFQFTHEINPISNAITQNIPMYLIA